MTETVVEDSKKPSGGTSKWSEGTIALVVAIMALVGTGFSAFQQYKSSIETATLVYQAADRSSDVKLIEIAIGVLRAPISEDVAAMRGWAMDLIDNTSKRKFTPEERTALLKRPLPSPPQATSLSYSSFFAADFCKNLRKNSDGGYTAVRPFKYNGRAVKQGETSTADEASYINLFCGGGAGD